MQYEWQKFNESTGWKRQFEMLAVLGVAALSDEKFRRVIKQLPRYASISSFAKFH